MSRNGHGEKSRQSLSAARRFAGQSGMSKLIYLVGESVVNALWDISDAIDSNTEAVTNPDRVVELRQVPPSPELSA